MKANDYKLLRLFSQQDPQNKLLVCFVIDVYLSWKNII